MPVALIIPYIHHGPGGIHGRGKGRGNERKRIELESICTEGRGQAILY
jgi:hypothetical protein